MQNRLAYIDRLDQRSQLQIDKACYKAQKNLSARYDEIVHQDMVKKASHQGEKKRS